MKYEYNKTGHRYPSAHRLGCISVPEGFPDMMTGNQYKLRLRYMLPGKNIITSFKDIIINY